MIKTEFLKVTIHSLKIALIALLVSISTTVAALPDHYPNSFDVVGVVGKIDLESRKLHLNGANEVNLSSSTKVHYPVRSKIGAVKDLRVGSKVGCTKSRSGSVTDIWILSPVQ